MPKTIRAILTALLLTSLVTPAASQAEPCPSPLLVADVGALSADEQMLFASLEGIVNRDAPAIYLEGFHGGQNYEKDLTAEAWLQDAVPMCAEPVASPYDLLTTFAGRVKGLVVWDPALAVDTQNVATTIAGQEDLLPVSPALAAVLSAAPYGFPVKRDLRGMFALRQQAYQWALDAFGPATKFGLLAWLGDTRNGWAGQHGLRDWIVARRGFAFEGDPKSEAVQVSQILDAFPAGTLVFGYPFFDDAVAKVTATAAVAIGIGEPFGVGEISRSGKVLIPSTDSTNLTVHSSFPSTPHTLPWDDHARAPDASKTYVSFMITDGDNLGYNQQGLRTLHWNDPARETTLPIGISVSPYLATLAPRIYDYYVRTLRPNEVLIGGPSGAGYAYPSFLPNLGDYLAKTRDLMDLSGLRAPIVLDYGYLSGPLPPVVDQYADTVRPSAIFTDYLALWPKSPSVSFAGAAADVPVIRAMWSHEVATTIPRIKYYAQLSAVRPAFVLVALNTWTMGFAQAQEIADALGASFEVVRPDELVGLVKGFGKLHP